MRAERIGWVVAAVLCGCIQGGKDVPPVKGTAPVTVDAATQTVGLDTAQVPVVPSCGAGQVVRRTESGWECAAYTWQALPGRPDTFPPAAHAHAAADVSGVATAAQAGALESRLAEVEARAGFRNQEFTNRVLNSSFEDWSGGLPSGWEKLGTGTLGVAAAPGAALFGASGLRLTDADTNAGTEDTGLLQVVASPGETASLLAGRTVTASVWARRTSGSGTGQLCLGESETGWTCADLAAGSSFARTVARRTIGSSPAFLVVALLPTTAASETATWEFDGVMATLGPAEPAWSPGAAEPAPEPDGTTLEVASGALRLADGAVTEAKLANAAVTAGKLAAGAGVPGRVAVADAAGAVAWGTVPWSSLAGVPGGFADGTDNDTQYSPLSGGGLQVSADNRFSIANLGVTTARLDNGAVTAQKMSAGAGAAWRVPVSDAAGAVAWNALSAGSGLAMTGTQFRVGTNAITSSHLGSDRLSLETMTGGAAGIDPDGTLAVETVRLQRLTPTLNAQLALGYSHIAGLPANVTSTHQLPPSSLSPGALLIVSRTNGPWGAELKPAAGDCISTNSGKSYGATADCTFCYGTCTYPVAATYAMPGSGYTGPGSAKMFISTGSRWFMLNE